MTTLHIAPDYWLAALIPPAPASSMCPHPDDNGAHYTTADDCFRCPDCLHTDPPPPHRACDRCHTGPPDRRCELTLEGCRIAFALCVPCITTIGLAANDSQQAASPQDTP